VKASGSQAIQQGLFAKGFAQESDCPCGQHLLTRCLIGLPCNKDRRRCETIAAEMSIELHATQTWHMHISDQTGRAINVIRTEEIFG
jgi:hypothetical protein